MRGGPNHAKEFLGYPSCKACARALGICVSSATRAAAGFDPGPKARAALAAAGWEPPPGGLRKLPPGRRYAAQTADGLNSDCGVLCDTATLMRAARKPRGCSDARWRMELRRRALAARTGGWGGWLPDPRDI